MTSRITAVRAAQRDVSALPPLAMIPRFLILSAAAVLLLAGAARAQLTNGALPVRFFDLAPQAGADVDCFGRGSAIVDLDGDGLLDLVATSAGRPMYLLRQLPGGGPGVVPQFDEMSYAWQIPPFTRETWGTVAADFDNDGDPDLYFPCGGFAGREENILLRNDLDTLGKFTSMSAIESGAAVSLSEASFSATATDYDRDGDLDLFTAATGPIGGGAPANCRLLRNEGGLYFTDVSAQAGITQLGSYKHTGVGDIDNDGWPDLGAGQMGGPARLWRNMGNGSFVEVAGPAGLAGPVKNFGFVFEDFDNDGWQDVFLPQYLHSASGGQRSRLFLNNGNGTFRDVSNASRIGAHEDMGHNVGDLNADGFPDIYIGAGHPATTSFDVLYLVRPNPGNGLLVKDVSVYSRIRSAGAGRNHGTPFGDVNGDGFVDIWAVNGGPSSNPTTFQKAYLWFSEGNSNRWLKADLRGVFSNRDGVGARATVHTRDGRDIHRTVSAGKGFANTDAHETHFGLGDTTRAAWLRVRWPSGIEQFLMDPPLERTSMVVETGLRALDEAHLGQSVRVEACGPAGQEVRLMAAMRTGRQFVPSWGGVLLLGGFHVDLPAATLGPSGRAVILVPCPADPASVGRSFYLQARILNPATGRGILSNRLDLPIFP